MSKPKYHLVITEFGQDPIYMGTYTAKDAANVLDAIRYYGQTRGIPQTSLSFDLTYVG